MEDKSFLYLTQDNIIEKINIDSHLIDSFKRVMAKQQEYFNANGYTSQRDYKEFFEEYLLKDMSDKLKILISDEPSKSGADGFYRHKEGVQEIHIDSSCLTYPAEYLDAVLSHEFIHFLVMRGLDKVEYPDPEIKNGGFINEAITEMLNKQMYPNSMSYMPQVNMLKFANLLTDKVNNYSLFLQGRVDSKRGASSWQNFVQDVAKYHREWVDKGFVMSQAVVDPNYIYAQRQLIQANIHQHLISSFEEYDKYLSIIEQRPAPDVEWIEQFKQGMDNGLLNKMNIRDSMMREFLEKQLKEYRTLPSKLKEYGNQDVIEFEIAGHKFAIDKNRRVFNTDRISYQSSWNPNTNMYEFKVGNEVFKINMATADFSKRRVDIERRLKDIPHIFSKSLNQDFNILNQNINTNGLKKIERFQLPNLEQSKTQNYIYVATYQDHIEILNSPIKLGTMQNVNHSQYIGITSKTNGAIYQKQLSQITNGIAFSTLTKENIDKRVQSYLYEQYKNSVTEEQLSQIIEQYRKSSEYDPEEEKNVSSFKNIAIGYYTRTKCANLTEEERKKLYDKVIENNPQYIVSTKDGQIDISLLFGKEYVTAFKGTSEVIVDTNSDALFNEYFSELQKGRKLSAEPEKEGTNILMDQNGNIIIPKEREEKQEMEKSLQEKLSDMNKQMEGLREQYGAIATQMEDLMKRNQQNPIPNYQEQLASLISKRDQIGSKISSFIEPKKVLEEDIKRQEQFKHNQIISQVEKMLSTRITSTVGYEYDDRLKAPMALSKDATTLRKEQAAIFQKLEQLYYADSIDLETWNSMKAEVLKEYNEMVAKASKQPPQPPVRDDSIHTQQQEQVPIQQQPIQHKTQEKVDDFTSDFRKKYNYDSMSDDEKRRFDKQVERKQSNFDSSQTDKQKKEQLEEQRRELRRKQFQDRARAMGLNFEQIANLDNLFMQQEIIEHQNLEEIEEIEQDHGMTM